MIFYDFEVTKYDWLVVLLDMLNQQETIIENDPDELEQYYIKHKENIWVGFNSRHYDQFILRAILVGVNPYDVSTKIIDENKSGYEILGFKIMNEYPLYNYDVMERIDRGLKVFEGFMGNNIKESSVDFRIDRKLTRDELDEMIKYCRHDVEQTALVFIERKSDFDAQMSLLKLYQMPLSFINKTKVQLSAEILGAVKRPCNDEFDIHLPPTMKVEKYTEVPKWFLDPENHTYTKKVGDKTEKTKLQIKMAGVDMIFAWGGVHGAKSSYHAKGYFINMDVGSLYPTIDILYPEYCFSRAVPPEGLEKYKEMIRLRLELKAAGKKKEQAPYKIVLNGTYGASKDKFNKLFDPRAANNTCVFGQILVGVDLFERLEEIGCEIIQVNTDGILIRMEKYDDYDLVDDVAHEWEQRTGLSLEFDDYGYGEIYQKDVNNYLIMDEWGKFKSKGAYVKSLGTLDYDLPIVNKSLVNFMTKKIPVEQTINDCNDFIEFQQVKKISYKYECLIHDDKRLKEQTVRVFASLDHNQGTLFKKHKTTGNLEKVSDCPEHLFIFNGAVKNLPVPDNLDKQWYVDLAKKRLQGFGVYQ